MNESTSDTPAPSRKIWRVTPQTLLVASVVFLGALFFAALALIVVLPRFGIGEAWAKRLPVPIALVAYDEVITERGLAENMAAIRQFYEEQDFSQVGLRVDFTTDEGKKRLLIREKEVFNKMLEDRAIEVLARKRGVVVTEEMARSSVERKLAEFGNADEVEANLERLYGWDLAEFQEKIVRPSLYEEALVLEFNRANDSVVPARERISEAAEALNQKREFAAVAREYSEGETAEEGGVLGWFALRDLAPELQSAVSTQKVGIPGAITESALGFHIVLVEEKRTEDGVELFRLSQIFTRKDLFADWLTEEMRAMKIFVWSPTYRYDPATARIEFKDEALRRFEAELLEKNSGDATFFF